MLFSSTANLHIMMKRIKLRLQLSRTLVHDVRCQNRLSMPHIVLVPPCTKESVTVYAGLAKIERAREQLDHQELVHKVRKGQLIYTKTNIRMHLEIMVSGTGIQCMHENACVAAWLSLYCTHLYLMHLTLRCQLFKVVNASRSIQTN